MLAGACMLSCAAASAAETKQLLLLSQGPDGHPPTTHEYEAGMRILSQCLSEVEGLSIETIKVEEPWEEGPDKIRQADGVVLYLEAGAKWMASDPRRLEAFRQLAARKGGIVALHWATGCREEEYIAPFVDLVGACHGGPHRRYQVLQPRVSPATPDHPTLQGVNQVNLWDEFYYRLQTAEPPRTLVPLLNARIDGVPQMVAWGMERPDGGRSGRFTGVHLHGNWSQEPYRRFVSQLVLWTMDLPIPEGGLPVALSKEQLKLHPKD